MRQFFKRLFSSPSERREPTALAEEPNEASPAAVTSPSATADLSGEAAVGRYFELLADIQRAKASGHFSEAIRAARETYPLFPAVVRKIKQDYGAFDLQRSPAVHTASRLMAVMGDRSALSELREVLSGTRELNVWLPEVEEAELDIATVDEILMAVAAAPGLKQHDLKIAVKASDGRRIATLVAALEKGKRLARVKQGATHLLYPFGHAPSQAASRERAHPQTAASPTAVATITLTRPRRRARPARTAQPLNLTGTPFFRLPKAPARWEARREPSNSRSRRTMGSVPHFSAGGAGWSVASEQALSMAERPDPAFKQVFPTAGSTLWLDPKGHRGDHPSSPSIAMTTDRAGRPVAERGLDYDVYRSDVNADGSGMLFLSREGILHGYSDQLEPIVLERVADLPEYAAQAKRFDIQPDELKNHTRCVAISADRSRFLLTIVDEAWCYDTAFETPLWGIRFPAKDGWTEVAAHRSERIGTSSEISAALALMELDMPVTPESLRHQYRVLARTWHPDLNPNDPSATRRLQELNAAMELLGGTDLSYADELVGEPVAYEKVLGTQSVTVDGLGTLDFSIRMRFEGAFGADWIYAANFAHSGHGAFLCGYGGRVVEVDASGRPVRIYDIGATPRHVADTARHRYILTDTRLYVVQQDSIEAIVDVFEQGQLLVGGDGFGLLGHNRLQWFTPTGQLQGFVTTRDPIRRVLSRTDGLVVETRSRRALIAGAPSWW